MSRYSRLLLIIAVVVAASLLGWMAYNGGYFIGSN